ncbi:epithelial-stromal interaction protein 1 [Stegastes partitus]|uniref:Epithelial-stromal interaction protein 1 n=1 Tax=Stegastes partitus TaxID=144197 RepID=A0A9Y4NGF0_9TELE|nr:PREDICTED: epithelial-stromal interaction protein 1-like [Stegastes partitus]
MPTTKLIKPKPVEATKKSPDGRKPGRPGAAGGAESHLKVAAVRKSRASSCPRNEKTKTGTSTSTGLQGSSSGTRTRSSSTAPRGTEKSPRATRDCRGASSAVRHREAAAAAAAAQREQRGGSQSHKAFTVIPPNPKKRREIQRKAEAELAALEELRLSRAMAYVSINPSSVGGCMSLEEVRLKQQQEMMQAKRKHKPVKQQVMEEAPVLTS